MASSQQLIPPILSEEHRYLKRFPTSSFMIDTHVAEAVVILHFVDKSVDHSTKRSSTDAFGQVCEWLRRLFLSFKHLRYRTTC